MSLVKHQSKALGLSLLAALGLVVLMAGGAQANWLVLSAGTQLETNQALEVNAHTEPRWLVPNQLLEFLCSVVASNGLTLTALSTLGTGSIKLTNCKTWIFHAVQPGCVPLEPLLAKGTIHLILHNGKNYILLRGEGENKLLMIFEFHSRCALPLKNNVTGTVVLECGHLQPANTFAGLDCANLQSTQLLRAAPNQELFGDALKYGLNPMVVDGIIAAKLSGSHAGAVWGSHI